MAAKLRWLSYKADMDLPRIRYYLDGRVQSDWVEVPYGEAVIEARLQKLDDGNIGWVDRSGLKLNHLPLPNGQETDESRKEDRQGDEGVQGRSPAQRQARKGQRSGRKKP